MKGSYRDLQVWQKGMDLADAVYATVLGFPKHELFGLSSQLRRAAAAIPSLIAEGHGRGSAAEFRRYLRDARGSSQEVETELLIAARQGYITSDRAETLIERCSEVIRLINGLIRYLDRVIANNRGK
jgi:four helix bundle protein